MVGPSKISMAEHAFTLFGLKIANTPELPRKLSRNINPCFEPFPHWRKAVAAGASVLRQFAAWRCVNADSYGDMVRNLKGCIGRFGIDPGC
jgi:hypothetical protein